MNEAFKELEKIVAQWVKARQEAEAEEARGHYIGLDNPK